MAEAGICRTYEGEESTNTPYDSSSASEIGPLRLCVETGHCTTAVEDIAIPQTRMFRICRLVDKSAPLRSSRVRQTEAQPVENFLFLLIFSASDLRMA